MIYLLDTCVISDFARGDVSTQQRFKHQAPLDLALSSVTVMEIQYGLKLNPAKAKKIQPIIEQLLSSLNVIRFGEQEAITAASIRAELKSLGMPIGAYDVLIGATAKANDLVMVTANTREFERIEGLDLENWRI